MDLIRLTFRKAAGGISTRYATSRQDVGTVISEYMRIIPGAVLALQATEDKDISEDTAGAVEKIFAAHQYAHLLRSRK